MRFSLPKFSGLIYLNIYKVFSINEFSNSENFERGAAIGKSLVLHPNENQLNCPARYWWRCPRLMYVSWQSFKLWRQNEVSKTGWNHDWRCLLRPSLFCLLFKVWWMQMPLVYHEHTVAVSQSRVKHSQDLQSCSWFRHKRHVYSYVGEKMLFISNDRQGRMTVSYSDGVTNPGVRELHVMG